MRVTNLHKQLTATIEFNGRELTIIQQALENTFMQGETQEATAVEIHHTIEELFKS